MPSIHDTKLHDLPGLRERTSVFADRVHGGIALGGMLEVVPRRRAVVLGIPAGGVAVAGEVALHLRLPLDVAVVSKITPHWNSEIGYGAVAFDGTVRLNDTAIRELAIGPDEVREGIERTAARIRRRVRLLRGPDPGHIYESPADDPAATPREVEMDLAGRTAIIVDDGLASGFTMSVAVEAVRKAGAAMVVAAAPTGHTRALEMLAPQVDAIYCPNVRAGYFFSVAQAYHKWRDVDEEELVSLLRFFRSRR